MNWKKLFAMHIFEREYDYYLENVVENIDVSEDIIRADVIGSEYKLYLPDKKLLQQKLKEWIEEEEE